MVENLVPEGAVHERLGIKTPTLVRTSVFNFTKLKAMNTTWLRRDQVIEFLRKEERAVGGDVILRRLIKVLEEGTE
jgi:hypothetical protein